MQRRDNRTVNYNMTKTHVNVISHSAALQRQMINENVSSYSISCVEEEGEYAWVTVNMYPDTNEVVSKCHKGLINVIMLCTKNTVLPW